MAGTIQFENGEVATAEVIVAADGIRVSNKYNKTEKW